MAGEACRMKRVKHLLLMREVLAFVTRTYETCALFAVTNVKITRT